MATSLGRLVLDMAADAAGFERDMKRIKSSAKKELNKVSRELWKAERDLDRARSKVNRLAGAMGALGAVAIAGVGREFRKFAQEADRLDKVSRTVGMTAEQIQELAFAAEQASGVGFETFAMAMQRFSRRVGEASNESGELLGTLKRLNINIRDAEGNLRSQTDLLLELADRTKNAASGQDALAISMKAFDSEGARMVTLMRQGSDAIKDYMEQARQTGSVLTTETIDATVKFNDALNVLSLNVKGLRNQFFADLIEPLAEYAEFLATTEEGQQAFEDMLKGVADAAKTLGTVIGIAFTGALGKAIITMGFAEAKALNLSLAKIRLTASTQGYTAAATRAAVATTVLGRAVNVALGPIGIAIGILSTLGLTYLSLRDEVEAASEDFDDFANSVDRAANSTREFTTAQLEGKLIDAGAKLSEINRELAELERSTSDELTILPDGMDDPVSGIIDQGEIERVRELRQEQTRLQAAIRKWKEDLENLSGANGNAAKTSEDFTRALDRLEASLSGKVAQAQQQYSEKLEQARQKHSEGEISLEQLTRAEGLYKQELEETLDSIRDSIDVHDEHVKAMRKHQVAMQDAGEKFSDMRASIEQEIGALSGGRKAWEEYRRAAFVNSQVDMLPELATDEMKSEIRELAEELYDLQEAARIEFEFENLLDSFHPLSQAMRRLGDDIDLINERIESGQMGNMEGMFVKSAVAANTAFAAMMSGVDQTSSEYKKLERAQQLTNIALGIAAILQQGMGDPYTAIPRMIAMAAMVASLGVNTGGIGGGGSARRQESQGTGTVLGDPSAKSESIANAVEITADATSKLVGINRGMLHALQQLQRGISGAAGMVARGAGMFDASGINLSAGSFESTMKGFHDSFDPLGSAIDSWVGGLFGFGKTKVVDQGIELLGGAITDMTEGAVGRAFADLKRKSLFGSKSKTAFEDLDDAFNAQLNLIFGSMIDTVEAAAEALGIPLDDIQARIAQFEVEAQKISLKGLSAEEQQAELEAVFSAIFDDLAASVIPFIGQFQRVGEGMAETLVRVATSVQVTEEAIKRLGLSIGDGLGPEKMAQVSVGLMEAAGGIENFISQMESFVSKFAPEAHKLAIAQNDITRALEQMGFSLPATREGFWNLMQSIDATTESGQQAIATLLSLTDAADEHYSNLEDIQSERDSLIRKELQLLGETDLLRELELETLHESNRAIQERVWALEDELAAEQELADIMGEVGSVIAEGLSPARASLDALMTRWRDLWLQARELGASEEQLHQVRRAARFEMARWISDMKLSTLQLAEDFFSVEQSFSQVGTSVTNTMDNMRDKALRALASIDEWLMSSQLDSNSPLTPVERLGEAESQFRDAFAAAMSGDFDALENLPGLADQFLSEAGGFFGTSTEQFRAIWDEVRALMNDAADIEPPPEMKPVNAAQMNTLIDTNSRFGGQIEALNKEMQAWQLGDQINALAEATNKTPAEIASHLGFTNQDMRNVLLALGQTIPYGTEAELRQHFNDVIGDIGESNRLLDGIEKLINTLNGIFGTFTTEFEKWVEGQELPPPPDDPVEMESFATGGAIHSTGPAFLHSGEYVVPRGGTLVSESGTSQDFTEVKAELNRISRHLERGNTDRREGLGMIVNEERSTRRSIDRKQQTVRAA